MSKIGQYVIEQEEQGNDLLAQYEQETRPINGRQLTWPVKIGKGVWFQDESEHWHRNPGAVGRIVRVMVHGVQFEKAPHEYLDEAMQGDNPPF